MNENLLRSFHSKSATAIVMFRSRSPSISKIFASQNLPKSLAPDYIIGTKKDMSQLMYTPEKRCRQILVTMSYS